MSWISINSKEQKAASKDLRQLFFMIAASGYLPDEASGFIIDYSIPASGVIPDYSIPASGFIPDYSIPASGVTPAYPSLLKSWSKSP
jgi:hypothetical protein